MFQVVGHVGTEKRSNWKKRWKISLKRLQLANVPIIFKNKNKRSFFQLAKSIFKRVNKENNEFALLYWKIPFIRIPERIIFYALNLVFTTLTLYFTHFTLYFKLKFSSSRDFSWWILNVFASFPTIACSDRETNREKRKEKMIQWAFMSKWRRQCSTAPAPGFI